MIHESRSIKTSIILALALTAPFASARSEDDGKSEQVIYDFYNMQNDKAWVAVNDNVMGGVSDGRVRMTDNGTLKFSGSVSLENNGGFASIRSRRADMDLSNFDGLLVRVRGDGKLYDFNLRTNVRIMAGSYRVKFETKSDVWREIYLPFTDFVPTSYGRVRNDLPALDSSKIRSFGFLISDKQAGPFALEVEWIKAVVSPEQPDSQSRSVPQTSVESAIRHWIEASIARGVRIYNAGEPRLCAEIYLLTVKSLLCLAPEELSPQAVEQLVAAVRESEESGDDRERAWILRRAMDFTLESLAQRTIEPLGGAALNVDRMNGGA